MSGLKKYVLDNINKSLSDTRLKEFFGKINNTKKIIEHMNYDGDVYLYLKRFKNNTALKNLDLFNKLNHYNYKTFEDISNDTNFLKSFDLSMVTKIDELIIGQKYDSYDIGVAVNNYNIRKGMYKSTNKNGDNIVVIKANIDDVHKPYVNTWIINDILKYYLETNNNIYDNKTMNKGPNKVIKISFIHNLKLDIHLFTRSNNERLFTYNGIFKCINFVDDKYIEITNISIIIPNIKSLSSIQESKISEDFDLESIESFNKAMKGIEKPECGYNIVNTYKRDPYVKHYVKKRANGKCELCDTVAPFFKKDNSPYLEVHHLITLSEGGPDTIYNCVALCPNCHRELHFGNIDINCKKYKKLVDLIYSSLTNENLKVKFNSLFNYNINKN